MHRLRVTEKNGQIREIYINAETMLESKIVMQVEQGGRKAIVTTEFSNYKTIDGITVPMHVRQMLNGKPMTEVTYDRVEFNVADPTTRCSRCRFSSSRPLSAPAARCPSLQPAAEPFLQLFAVAAAERQARAGPQHARRTRHSATAASPGSAPC